MTYFDFYELFLDFGPLCRKKCSFLMKPHTSVLDSHFFLEVKVIAQGSRVFMPRALSFRIKSRFPNVKSWFAFLRKYFRIVRKMLVWMYVFDYRRPLDVFIATFWWCANLIIQVVVFESTLGASNVHILGRGGPTYFIENSRKHQKTPETSKDLVRKLVDPGVPTRDPGHLL